MTTHNSTDERLPGEAELRRAYRAGAREQPPPALDAQILAQARQALEPPRSLTKRWVVPISVAAVLVLSVSVTWRLSQRATPEFDDLALSEVASEPETKPTDTPSEAPRAATPESAKPPAVPAAPPQAGVAARKRAAAKPEPLASAPAAMDNKSEDRMAKEEFAAAGATIMQAKESEQRSAEVVGVRASGAPGAYNFNVTISSPDTGCAQYADWWEVVGEDGKLLYRRVLLHSHVDEQPFTRGGGPVPIQPDTVVWVRAHMNTSGYGLHVYKGTVNAGFEPATAASGFAAALAEQPPLPTSCAF